MTKKVISTIPNAITLCNLLSGCIAIYMAFHLFDPMWGLHGMQWAWIAIAAAAVFDFCDGFSARTLKAYSEIGKQLDSLSDLVSFGVAPGMLMLNLMQYYCPDRPATFLALLIPALGAYRLAKFNVDTTQSVTFRGLPIPANAIFWIGMSAWIEQYRFPGMPTMSIIIVLISWLMISDIRMFSLKFKNLDFRENFRRYVLMMATVAFLIIWGVSGLVWTILLYILISVLGRKDLQD